MKPPLPWTASDWLAANDKLASIQQWSLIAKTRTFLHWRLNRLMHVEVSCHSYPQLGLTWIFVFAVQRWLSSHRVKDIFLFAVLNVKYIFVRSRALAFYSPLPTTQIFETHLTYFFRRRRWQAARRRRFSCVDRRKHPAPSRCFTWQKNKSDTIFLT